MPPLHQLAETNSSVRILGTQVATGYRGTLGTQGSVPGYRALPLFEVRIYLELKVLLIKKVITFIS